MTKFLINTKVKLVGLHVYIKIGGRVMLTYNIDTSDKLSNGQIGTIVNIEINHGKVKTIYVRFDKHDVGLNKRLAERV